MEMIGQGLSSIEPIMYWVRGVALHPPSKGTMSTLKAHRHRFLAKTASTPTSSRRPATRQLELQRQVPLPLDAYQPLIRLLALQPFITP
jgi:hypothetical protein